MFVFVPLKERNQVTFLSQRVSCMIKMPTPHFCLSTRSVKLVSTSLEMLSASAAKPIVQGSTEEMVGPWNHRSIPVYVYLPCKCCLCSSGLMCLRSIEPRLSRYLSKYPNIFQPFWHFPSVWKPSILYGNLPDCLEILQTVQNSCRLSGNLPDFPEIF